MKLTLNTETLQENSLAEDIRATRSFKLNQLEIWIPKLEYALQGGSLSFIKKMLRGDQNNPALQVRALRVFPFPISEDKENISHLDAQIHSLAASAAVLGAGWVTVKPETSSIGTTMEIASLISRFAKIVAQYGAIQIELLMDKVADTIQVVDATGRSNVGFSLDISGVAVALEMGNFDLQKVATVSISSVQTKQLIVETLPLLKQRGYTGAISLTPPPNDDLTNWASQQTALIRDVLDN